MALDATVGGATSNSFLTREEAIELANDHPFATAWLALTDAEKDKTLILASRLIDRLCWLGSPLSTTQALAFPRSGLKASGRYIPSDTIPQQIKNAVFEYALLIGGGTNPGTPSDAAEQGLKRVKAGPVEVEFQKLVELKILPEPIMHWIPERWLCPDPKKVAEFKVL